MDNYKKSFWASNFLILLFAILLTCAVKFIFNTLLFQHQESILQKPDLRDLPVITNVTQLSQLAQSDLFSYIKVSNAELATPLIYQAEQANILAYLLPVSSTILISRNGHQSIEFKAKNSQLLTLLEKVILSIYMLLMITSALIHLIYFRLFKRIETTLLNEISNEDSPVSPFSKVSQRLHEQKQSFQHTLQDQEKQISILAQQVNMDNLTQLNNRHAFRKELLDILSTENGPKHAILFIIRATELNAINSQLGYQQGDDYIVSIANILTKVTSRSKFLSVYRINGSDFSIIAREMSPADAQRIAKNLKTEFDQYQTLNKLDGIAYSGISAISSGQLPEQVLARTDMALAKAQTDEVNSWAFEQQDADTNLFGQQHWRQIIEAIISKRALMLLHQPIQAIHRNMQGYHEIFTRFIGDNNQMFPTGTIFAMAQRIDMIVKLEQLILETLVSQCRHKTDDNCHWGINITSSAMQNSGFIVWLERLLLREPKIAACLIFEMREEVLDSNLVASKRIFDMLKRTGTRSAICHFGKGIGSFRLFRELRPNFVKIDASLISHIERDSANQQFVRMIIDVAHRMDCLVIAEGVEHLEQKQILENMYIDGVQGFLIARPTPF
ncbi:MAG: RNase E specificity factor CsrD [Psychromonas sp.]|jgi:RNase E specificity factor CsrD|uniref:EAL domain-containing protein n=1 Tax=Psychromonas sp. TaxID=1884585 RepID=UPI0039E49110